MSMCEVRRVTALSPGDAFARVTRWQDHQVPFTRSTLTETGFVARTSLGPVGFDDPMVVSDWQPPHRVRIDKVGRVMRGWATIEVQPTATGSVVLWRESLRIAWVPAVLDPLVRWSAGMMVRRVLANLLG